MTGPLHPEATAPNQPGTWGWWPVIAGRVIDIQPGDRVTLPESDACEPFIVETTEVWESIRRKIVTADGQAFSIGLLYTPVHIDRPAEHALLAGSCQ